jgi:hypothetical protein
MSVCHSLTVQAQALLSDATASRSSRLGSLKRRRNTATGKLPIYRDHDAQSILSVKQQLRASRGLSTLLRTQTRSCVLSSPVGKPVLTPLPLRRSPREDPRQLTCLYLEFSSQLQGAEGLLCQCRNCVSLRSIVRCTC